MDFDVVEHSTGRMKERKPKNEANEGDKRPQRTSEEWKKIYPHYPTTDDGYLQAFTPDQSEEYLAALEKYGFCVVKVLNAAECDATLPEFLFDANENPKGLQMKKITLDDPTTWERDNWPSNGKFAFTRNAFGQRAFDNRTNDNVYSVFSRIYNETKLWCSIDKWGVMKGTKNLPWKDEDGNESVIDRPDWHYELKMHWDLNPWLYPEESKQHHQMYQGLVALIDCPEEVGGFICVPGSTAFLPEWIKNKKPVHLKPLSIQVPQDDIMLQFKQKVPLRKGEMVVWNSGQAHANFANTGNRMRLYQFIRMMPACEKCKARDRFSAPRVLEDNGMKDYVDTHVKFTPLGRKIAALDPWE